MYELDVSLPSLEGKCRLTVLDRLPRYTFLFGTDFGREKLLDLLSHVKSSPAPALAVTRAMAASDELAEKMAQALQLSEGASPVALEDIAEVVESESVPEQSPDLAISPSLDTSDHLSLANTISDSDLVASLPSLTFDGVSKDEFLALQKSDPSLKQLWDDAHKDSNTLFIVKDLLMCLTTTSNHVSSALIVPKSLRTKVIQVAHDGHGHGGLNATRSLINPHFSWPNMASDIREHISKCCHCLKNNKSGALKVPMLPAEVISERCEKLAVDIVGPLPKAKHNFRFIFTAMELASGFPFAVPLKSYTAENTAQALLGAISVTGPPLAVLSDQGPNFMSKVLLLLYKKLGIYRVRTSPYHPQSNGRLERFHATLKTMLVKFIHNKHDWPTALDLVLFFIRNIPHSRHVHTPHELLFLKPSPFILSTSKSFWVGDSDSHVSSSMT